MDWLNEIVLPAKVDGWCTFFVCDCHAVSHFSLKYFCIFFVILIVGHISKYLGLVQCSAGVKNYTWTICRGLPNVCHDTLLWNLWFTTIHKRLPWVIHICSFLFALFCENSVSKCISWALYKLVRWLCKWCIVHLCCWKYFKLEKVWVFVFALFLLI